MDNKKVKYRIYTPTTGLLPMMGDGNVDAKINYIPSTDSLSGKELVLDVVTHEDAAKYWMPDMVKHGSRVEKIRNDLHPNFQFLNTISKGVDR